MCAIKPATLLKVTLLHGCFSRFLNCTNGTKLCKTSHIIPSDFLHFLVQIVPDYVLNLINLIFIESASHYLFS